MCAWMASFVLHGAEPDAYAPSDENAVDSLVKRFGLASHGLGEDRQQATYVKGGKGVEVRLNHNHLPVAASHGLGWMDLKGLRGGVMARMNEQTKCERREE